MRCLLLTCVLATQALASVPSFIDLMPAAPAARRSSGGVLLNRGVNDSFFAYGGFNGGGMPLAEFLEYRTTANAWLPLSPGLPGRERHGLGYDPVSSTLVIAGGANGVTVFDTVLLIKGGVGTQPPSPATRPSARIDPLLAWIPEWGKFFYFGGRTSVFSNSHVNDMWTLDVADGGVTWAPHVGGAAPSARGAVCWGRDPSSGKLIMFGGEGSSNLADTWTFQPDAGAWTQLTVTGAVPTARSFAACAWDENLNQLVLYGGQTSTQVGGLYSFNPATNVWRSWDAGAPSPGPLSDSAAAFSPVLSGTVIFGGQTASATYTNRTWLLTFANIAPLVDAGANQTVGEGVLVQLDGQVNDPDGDPVTVSWTQTNGPAVTLSDAGALAPTFTSPRVLAPTLLRFVLQGDDGTGAIIDDVNVTVQNTINEAPVADAGPDQLAEAGALVTLVGSGVDPNGDVIVGATWMQVSGPAVTLNPPNALTTTFVAPQPSMPTALTFTLVVRDATLASAPDQVTVNVFAFDAGVDAGFDAGADGGLDGGTDGGLDGGVDGGLGGLDGGIDGGMDDAGTPDASVADAGEDDAGSGDAGVPDAGVEDAGAGNDSDAGPVAAQPYQLTVGCGCAEAPFSAMWTFALLALALSARRRQSSRLRAAGFPPSRESPRQE